MFVKYTNKSCILISPTDSIFYIPLNDIFKTYVQLKGQSDVYQCSFIEERDHAYLIISVLFSVTQCNKCFSKFLVVVD